MSKLDSAISDNPHLSYREEKMPCNVEEFKKVVESRRSVRIYSKEPVPENVVRECLSLALLAPNSSNLQPWSFYWVRSEDKKTKLQKICMNQLSARTAQELIVCVAEPYRWKEHSNQMLAEFKKYGNQVPKAANTYYSKLAPFIYTQGPLSILGYLKKILFFFVGFFQMVPREPTTHQELATWAIKSTALACENLMLAFSAHGFDTCPMEGFDRSKLKRLLRLKWDDHPVMVVSVGKRADEGVFGPRIRFDEKLFIHEI